MQQEWGQRVLDELKNAEQWLTDHPLALPVLAALLSLGAIFRLAISFSKNAPHMQLGFTRAAITRRVILRNEGSRINVAYVRGKNEILRLRAQCCDTVNVSS